MYLKCLVPLPETGGKIVLLRRKNDTYVYYETGRTYDKDKQYTAPSRVAIGKLSKANPDMMQPNENFVKYFPEKELPDEQDKSLRSSCIRIGSYIVLRQLMKESGALDILSRYFTENDLGLFIDLVCYSIVTEGNAMQYYPDYAYNHPLFTPDMRIYSDSKVSRFLNSIDIEQCAAFLNDWNERHDHKEKIYISYDSTNKNCQAGDIEIAEFGNAKDDPSSPIINYSVAYDTQNKEPLFYEQYPGSINDVSQLQFMLGKAKSYGYKKVGFILDRGYFSKRNLEYMDEYGYSFVIMVKGMASFVNELISKHKGSFEESWQNSIRKFDVFGKTVPAYMYPTDSRRRYFHIYYSNERKTFETRALSERIELMKNHLMSHANQKVKFGPAYEKYFYLHYDKDQETFLLAEEKLEVINEELKLCGYFAIVTSEKMTAKDAIELYKSRDVSEKMFRSDKSFLGNSCLRVHSTESASAKMFIEFIALIIRCKLYTKLKNASETMEKKQNYMTVPAALRELEKIEMVRQLDNIYRLDHAVTKTQKTILSAFDIKPEVVKYKATFISDQLKKFGGAGYGQND